MNLYGRSCRTSIQRKRRGNYTNNTKPDCDPAIGQHLLENGQCALNYDNKRFSILATARSSFHRISRHRARLYADRKSLFTLSNSFDNRGIWLPASLSLTFAIATSLFGALYHTSAIIGSS